MPWDTVKAHVIAAVLLSAQSLTMPRLAAQQPLAPRRTSKSLRQTNRVNVPGCSLRTGTCFGAVAMAAGALVGAVLAWSAWRVWRPFERVEVSGPSMAPSLQPGDRLLVWRTRSVRPGDIVAASDPRRPERSLLKRVVDVGQEGVFLLGDNPEHSTDSRQFGPVPMASVRGKAIYRYAPPARAGKLL